MADRCDLKGVDVNLRLERVAETLEKILESWTLSLDEVSMTNEGKYLTQPSPGTPRISQVDLLLSGRRTITELENCQQVTCLYSSSFFENQEFRGRNLRPEITSM